MITFFLPPVVSGKAEVTTWDKRVSDKVQWRFSFYAFPVPILMSAILEWDGFYVIFFYIVCNQSRSLDRFIVHESVWTEQILGMSLRRLLFVHSLEDILQEVPYLLVRIF